MEGRVISNILIKPENLNTYKNIFPLIYLQVDELENLLVKGKCEHYTVSKGFCINQLLEGKIPSGNSDSYYSSNNNILENNKLSCFLLFGGKLKCTKKEDSKDDTVSNFRIESYNLYGLDGPILGHHLFIYDALEPTQIILIPKDKLLETIERNKAFNYQVSIKILQKEGVLAPIIQFKSFLKHCSNENQVDINVLLSFYKKVGPLNHRYAKHPKRIDFKSWAMAIKSLPEMLPSMTNILLFLKLPEMFKNFKENKPTKSSDNNFKPLNVLEKHKPTKPPTTNSDIKLFNRKFDAYNIFKVLNSSKYIILLRDFDTDLQEFIGNICIHLIETKKFISLMRNHEAFYKLCQCTFLSELLYYFKCINMSDEEIKDFQEACFSNPSSLGKQVNVRSIVEFFSACFMQYANLSITLKLPSSFIKPSNLNLLINKIGVKLNQYPNKQVHLMFCSRRCLARIFDSNIFEKGTEILKTKNINLENNMEYIKNGNDIDKICFAYGVWYKEKNSSSNILFTQENSGYYPMPITEDSDKHFYYTLINLEQIKADSIDPEIGKIINGANKNDLILCVNYLQGHLSIEGINNLCLLLAKRLKSFGFIGEVDSMNVKGQKPLQTKRVIIADKFIYDETSDIALANFSYVNDAMNLNTLVTIENQISGLTSSMNLQKNLQKNFECGSILTAGAGCMRNHNLYSVYSRLFQCKGVDSEGFYIARELKRMRDEAIIVELKKISFVYILLNSEGDEIFVKGNENLYNCGHPLQNSVYRSVISYLIT